MVYRGRVTAGVVVLDGDRPRDGTVVQVIPVEDAEVNPPTLASHPAVGIWKDRTDLPEDPSAAKALLGRKLMGPTDG